MYSASAVIGYRRCCRRHEPKLEDGASLCSLIRSLALDERTGFGDISPSLFLSLTRY